MLKTIIIFPKGLIFHYVPRSKYCITIFRTLSIIVNPDIFTSYSDIFSHIVTYSKPCVTLAYSEPCNIQNPDIFGIQDTFRTWSRRVLAYSERCGTLAYSEPCHIQNFVIFRILVYLGPAVYWESCLYSTFRHI